VQIICTWSSWCHCFFSTSSLVYHLVWSPPPHIPYISSSNMSSFRNTCPYHRNLFCCSTKVISSWLSSKESKPNTKKQTTREQNGKTTEKSKPKSEENLTQQKLIFLNVLHKRRQPFNRRFFQDNLGKLAPESLNHSGLQWSKRWWGGSGISWTICKSFAPRSKQITTPAPHHSIFTGQMLFLTTNQQCQSNECKNGSYQALSWFLFNWHNYWSYSH